jgi:hypothetical protein
MYFAAKLSRFEGPQIIEGQLFRHIPYSELWHRQMTIYAFISGGLIVDFLRKHSVLMALITSAAWFFAGRDYFQKGNLAGAFLWEGIAVLILVAYCAGVVFFAAGSWVSLVVAIGAIGVEIWLMKRWMPRDPRRG